MPIYTKKEQNTAIGLYQTHSTQGRNQSYGLAFSSGIACVRLKCSELSDKKHFGPAVLSSAARYGPCVADCGAGLLSPDGGGLPNVGRPGLRILGGFGLWKLGDLCLAAPVPYRDGLCALGAL